MWCSAIAFAISARSRGGTPWASAKSRARAALRRVKSTERIGLGRPVSWNSAATYSSSLSNVVPSSAASAAPHAYDRREWLSTAGDSSSSATSSASVARDESGGRSADGSRSRRRPECRRSAMAARPPTMASSPRTKGRASASCSRGVSTPQVRSVHSMVPMRCVASVWFIAEAGSTYARTRRRRRSPG